MNKTIRYLCGVASICTAAIFALPGIAGIPAVYAMDQTEILRDEAPDPPPVFESGDYSYQFNGDETITIVDYAGQESEVVIPSKIDGHPVTAVSMQAYTYLEMTSLTIPKGIQQISGQAFQYCTITDTISLPEDIVILTGAFEYTELPDEVMIPEGAEVRGDSFSYCTGLETLFVEPGAVLKGSAFSYCRNLQTVVCASGSGIDEKAFYSCSTLEQVVLCGDVTLGENPFPYSDKAEMLLVEEEEYDQMFH